MNIPIANKNPNMVFVCAVAFMAGAILIGIVFSIKPLVALIAFGALRITSAVQTGKTPKIIRPKTQRKEKVNIPVNK